MVKLESDEDGLVFRVCENTPDVVRQVLLERGWTEYDEDDEENEGEWNLWWRTQRFRKSEHLEVANWQRLNHFPRTDAITRKDCLVRNLRRMRCVHGASVYNFHPLSYILPNEYTKFVSDYAKESQKNKNDCYWICKPTDLSRGRGIFVFKDLKDLTYDCPVIVQKYVSAPLLISGYKFDLRIYVCVPSFQPLTIYIYQEGLVRFGTDKFDLGQLGNIYSHLTNTSINKYGPAYSADKERVGPGCKWTLSQLRHFFRQMDDVDETLLWQKITNIVTLTLAAQAPTVPKSQSCFEVFGFDILIDQNFKPWLLEVNFSPALSMDCQADFIAKRSMLNDLIDLLNFKSGDAERGGKAYRECRSPSPSRERARRSRYGRFSRDTDHSSRFRKYDGRGSSRKDDKKGFTPRSTYRSATDQSRFSQTIPKVTKTSVDDEGLEEDIYDLETTVTPLPRNFSSTSVASSNSSGDSQDKSIPTECLGVPELDELKLSRKARDSWTGGAQTSNRKLATRDKESQSLTSRSLPGLHISPVPPCTGTLPKIRSSRSTASLKPVMQPRQSFRPLTPLDSVSNAMSDDSNNRVTSMETSGKESSKLYRPSSRSQPARSKLMTSSGRRQLFTDAYSESSTSNNMSSKKSLHESNHRKLLGKYKSPYSIRSISTTAQTPNSSPWPRTRVGDFVLAFPLNEAMRKASGTNFDPKTIIREVQKLTRRLVSKDGKKDIDKRRKSATITKSEAIELSFMLKFDDKESNPLYFWGPQHPPLLSSVLS